MIARVKSRGYLDGVEGNLKMLPEFYPGWMIRLYLDLRITDQLVKGSVTQKSYKQTPVVNHDRLK